MIKYIGTLKINEDQIIYNESQFIYENKFLNYLNTATLLISIISCILVGLY